MKQLLFLFFIAANVTGCATILNPYNEDFSCPETYNGKCVSITEAYEESLNDKAPMPTKAKLEKPHIHGIDCDYEEECDEAIATEKREIQDKKETTADEAPQPQTAKQKYRQALYDKLTNLLKEPAAPMVAQPKVMRVLMLPYEGENNALYMYRYVYIFAEPPRWILDEIEPKGID